MSVLFKKITQSKWTKAVALTSVSLTFVACTQTNSAQVKDISNSAVLTDNSQNTEGAQTPYSYENRPVLTRPANSAAVQTHVTPTSTTTVTTNNKGENTVVTTSQERIVYTRNYEDMPKGGYKGDSYTVKRGDTLFYIAWITGNDYRALAARNNIKEPYDLKVGQTLDVTGNATVVVTQKTTTSTSPKPVTTTNTTKPSTAQTTVTQVKPVTTTVTTTTTTTPTSNTNPAVNTSSTVTTTAPTTTVANIRWQWPAQGKVIDTYSTATKGIDIAGSLGDKVVSAAAGRVVYVGNALPGYGNLIIVKHNDDYLTAYAHNQSILVKEQQDVNAGQQIATMGNTGTSSVRLHFEIRYKAKAIDPMKYLPKN